MSQVQVQPDSAVDALWTALQVLPDDMRDRFIERLAADGPIRAAIAQRLEPAPVPGTAEDAVAADPTDDVTQPRKKGWSHDAAPLDGATRGRLRLSRGAVPTTIDADPALGDLFHAHFAGSAPRVRVHGGTVDIRQRDHWLAHWIWNALHFWRDQSAEIWLNGSIPWEVEIRGGIAGLHANLDAVPLLAFEIEADASDIKAALPRPQGTVPIRISADASQITLTRPAGVAAQVRLRNLAAKVTLDDQESGGLAAKPRLATADYDQAIDRYDVEVAARAAEVTITSG